MLQFVFCLFFCLVRDQLFKEWHSVIYKVLLLYIELCVRPLSGVWDREGRDNKIKHNRGNYIFNLLLVSGYHCCWIHSWAGVECCDPGTISSGVGAFSLICFSLCVFLNSSLLQPAALLLAAFKNLQVKLSAQVALCVVINALPGGGLERTSYLCSCNFSGYLSPLISASCLLCMSAMVDGWVGGALWVLCVHRRHQHFPEKEGDRISNSCTVAEMSRVLSRLCSAIPVPVRTLWNISSVGLWER